jgi:CelD/BcsL family acetyltransferase involved in cellulose biosynthesis
LRSINTFPVKSLENLLVFHLSPGRGAPAGDVKMLFQSSAKVMGADAKVAVGGVELSLRADVAKWGDGGRSIKHISTQVLVTRSEIEDIKDEWLALAAKFPQYATMNGPDWVEAWLNAYDSAKYCVITARIGDELVGLIHLNARRGRYIDFFIRRICPLGAGAVDYQRPLVRSDLSNIVLPILISRAMDYYGRNKLFWFPNIPIEDKFLEVLKEYCSNNKMAIHQDTSRSYQTLLEGKDFNEIKRSWGSSAGRGTLRRLRKIEKESGPVELWFPQTFGEVKTFLDEFFEVHDDKWNKQGYPPLFGGAGIRRHYYALAKQMWPDRLRLSAIRCAGVNISYQIGFISGEWLQGYRTTYRWDYRSYSPSKIHMLRLMEHASHEGLKGYDHLLGDEPYKLEWASEEKTVVSVYTSAGFLKLDFLWFSTLRPMVGRWAQIAAARARAVRAKLTAKPVPAQAG